MEEREGKKLRKRGKEDGMKRRMGNAEERVEERRKGR